MDRPHGLDRMVLGFVKTRWNGQDSETAPVLMTGAVSAKTFAPGIPRGIDQALIFLKNCSSLILKSVPKYLSTNSWWMEFAHPSSNSSGYMASA